MADLDRMTICTVASMQLVIMYLSSRKPGSHLAIKFISTNPVTYPRFGFVFLPAGPWQALLLGCIHRI